MKKCVVWGIGEEYDRYVNLIQYQVTLGTISVEAYISKDQYCNTLDGKKVLVPEKIHEVSVEWCIVCNTFRFNEIKENATSLGFDENKIISVSLFEQPYFNFEEYAELIENPVSIISDDCWGAEVYHYLHLPFSSPFILCYMQSEDYMKLLENLDYYLEQPLECYRQADLDMMQHPIGMLGEEDNKVLLYFNHSISFEEAKEDWMRRKKRMNRDNIFVKMTILDEKMAERFSKLPFQKKIGFYLRESNLKDIYYLPEWRWNDEYMRRYRGYSFTDYVRAGVRNEKVKAYNILKLIVEHTDYMRKR